MFNINDAYINALNEDHNLRAPYDRSKGQISQILNLCEEVTKKTGKEISFDNTGFNSYTLYIDGNEYEYCLYKDVINALNMVLLFI